MSDGSAAYDSLMAMNAARLANDISATDALNQLRLSLGETAGGGDFSPLLINAVVVRLAKRYDLLSAFERGIHTFRILTDIRPVFGEKVDSTIDAVLVTNTLQLTYHCDGELRERYFRVDTEDLESMLQQADRALSKIRAIEKFVSGAGAVVLGDDPEESA